MPEEGAAASSCNSTCRPRRLGLQITSSSRASFQASQQARTSQPMPLTSNSFSKCSKWLSRCRRTSTISSIEQTRTRSAMPKAPCSNCSKCNQPSSRQARTTLSAGKSNKPSTSRSTNSSSCKCTIHMEEEPRRRQPTGSTVEGVRLE